MRHINLCASRRRGGQAGYTLIEMLIVIAILGLLTVAVNEVILQTVRISSHGADSMTAIKQLESAFHWLTIDVQQAQRIETEVDSGFPLSLGWTDWDGLEYSVNYTLASGELRRSAVVVLDDAVLSQTETVVARYLSPDTAATYCRVSGNGAFLLPDANDAITITGGDEASSGRITISSGSVAVTTTGTATYNNGEWSTPAAGDKVIITAAGANTSGIWNAVNTDALLALTADADADAELTGDTLILTLTASGGDRSPYSETRQGMVFARS